MEVNVGDLYYHKHMYQQFKVMAIDGNYVWLKSEEYYLTTTIGELEKDKSSIKGPTNSGV
jgi:hypothetical protein